MKEQISGLGGCYIAERRADLISEKLIEALSFPGRTDGRRRIEEKHLTNDLVANKLIEVYKRVKR